MREEPHMRLSSYRLYAECKCGSEVLERVAAWSWCEAWSK